VAVEVLELLELAEVAVEELAALLERLLLAL
jgi:hypothetical protein